MVPTVIGWMCPGCGACYSPYEQRCWNCDGLRTVTTGSNITVGDGCCHRMPCVRTACPLPRIVYEHVGGEQ